MNFPLTPDGFFYLSAGTGAPVPHPYRMRWALPRLLGADAHKWAICTYTSFALLPFAAWFYFSSYGLSGWRSLGAACLLCALPGHRIASRYPVLTDAPAFTLSLLCASIAHSAHPWACIPVALGLGAVRETGPVFAALWAWNPLPLIGLLTVGWWRPKAKAKEPWLTHPFKSAIEKRLRLGLDWTWYVRPWGAVLSGLLLPTWQMLACVVVAHAQLIMAMDTLRLTVWAAPVVCSSAAQWLPLAWMPLAVLATLMIRNQE